MEFKLRNIKLLTNKLAEALNMNWCLDSDFKALKVLRKLITEITIVEPELSIEDKETVECIIYDLEKAINFIDEHLIYSDITEGNLHNIDTYQYIKEYADSFIEDLSDLINQ